ncbi:MAG: hypothetical protein ACP5U2_17410 [Bryobacteraceae bacterium]
MGRILLVSVLAVAEAMSAVKIEKIAYQGWPNCYRVSNGRIEVVVTGDVGPRIIRCGFVGGRNLFKEFPEQMGKSGEKEFQLRGGHRLWVAPERLETTWAPDNAAVRIEVRGEELEATAPVEPGPRLQKQIIVRMSDSEDAVEVIHRVRNANPWRVEFAPWALTMMAPGGVGVAGLPPRGKHPEALLPTNPLVMWAYTDLSDPRWMFFAKYIGLRQDPARATPQKIGLFNRHTWAAYVLDSELFLKQTEADPAATYPDFGCSFETFTNDEFLELETLGPLRAVEPGATAEHRERWRLLRNVRVGAWTQAELDRVLAPLVVP